MDWIKIKGEHISPEYTDAQVGALVRFQLLIARLKRMPTDKELAREMSRKNWTSLVVVLSSFGVDPKLICSKVLEDVNLVQKKKEASRSSSRLSRLKNNGLMNDGDTSRDTSRDCHGDSHVTTQRREDKIREEKRREKDTLTCVEKDTHCDPFENDYRYPNENEMETILVTNQTRLLCRDIYKSWPLDKRGNAGEFETKAIEIFKKTGWEIEKVKTAVDNYMASNVVKKGMVMFPTKWIREWENWLEYKPGNDPDSVNTQALAARMTAEMETEN